MLERVKQNIKDAMRAKETIIRDILRMVMTKANTTAKVDKNRETSNRDVLEAIQKQIKQNKEFLEIVKDETDDRVNLAKEEITLLETYLPKQLSETEIGIIVNDIILDLVPENRNMKSMGRIMSKLQQYKDVMDMKMASLLIKARLS